MKYLNVLFISFILSACGGGGSSSSGSNEDKVVSRCITVSTRANNIPGSPIQSSTVYTNACEFAVSLAFERTFPGVSGPFTVAAGQEETAFLGSRNYIACRPPSQATNRGDIFDIKLDCT